jgi:hypothetical protein
MISITPTAQRLGFHTWLSAILKRSWSATTKRSLDVSVVEDCASPKQWGYKQGYSRMRSAMLAVFKFVRMAANACGKFSRFTYHDTRGTDPNRSF